MHFVLFQETEEPACPGNKFLCELFVYFQAGPSCVSMVTGCLMVPANQMRRTRQMVA